EEQMSRGKTIRGIGIGVVIGWLALAIVRTQAQPANDAFAACTSLAGNSGTWLDTNVDATKEPGEPAHGGDSGGKSVWYCWTAPTGAAITIDTIGSSFDTLLAVYSGDTVTSLSLIAGNDDIDPGIEK